jgi:hypothetical protein
VTKRIFCSASFIVVDGFKWTEGLGLLNDGLPSHCISWLSKRSENAIQAIFRTTISWNLKEMVEKNVVEAVCVQVKGEKNVFEAVLILFLKKHNNMSIIKMMKTKV